MQYLYMDSESGVTLSEETRIWLHRQGINLHPRARGQQMPYIDKRSQFMRRLLNTILDQLKDENMSVPVGHIVSEAQFVSNAMLSVDNYTPYNALYGRTPRLLPNMNMVDNAGNFEEVNGTLRNVHRLREISIMSMVQESAKTRVQEALNTRSRTSGQALDLKPGELVDFYRPPSSKDASGWKGPATVVSALPEQVKGGAITIRFMGRPFDCRFQDMRRHLEFFVFLTAVAAAFPQSKLWQRIRQAIDYIRPGHIGFTGWRNG